MLLNKWFHIKSIYERNINLCRLFLNTVTLSFQSATTKSHQYCHAIQYASIILYTNLQIFVKTLISHNQSIIPIPLGSDEESANREDGRLFICPSQHFLTLIRTVDILIKKMVLSHQKKITFSMPIKLFLLHLLFQFQKNVFVNDPKWHLRSSVNMDLNFRICLNDFSSLSRLPVFQTFSLISWCSEVISP